MLKTFWVQHTRTLHGHDILLTKILNKRAKQKEGGGDNKNYWLERMNNCIRASQGGHYQKFIKPRQKMGGIFSSIEEKDYTNFGNTIAWMK